MSWTTIARKDFADGARAKSLWALSALFIVFAAGAAYLYAEVFASGPSGDVTALGLIGFLNVASSTLIPIIALLVGYKAIAGERESGSLKLLLGLPHSRADVVTGKLAGRTLVVALPILVGYLIAAGIGIAMYTSFDVVNFLLFTLLTVLLGMSFVGIAVGFSSATRSVSRAGALAIGVWLVFQFLWGVITLLLVWAANGFSLDIGQVPEWAIVFNTLSPGTAYGLGVASLLPSDPSIGLMMFGTNTGAQASGDLPFYLTGWYGVLVLVAWVVVPTVLGYLRFDGTDL